MNEFQQNVRFYGLRLLQFQLKACREPIIFFRKKQIEKWDLIKNVTCCIKVTKNVLWMRLFEEIARKSIPGNCTDIIYIPFFKEAFPKGKRYYRFRTNIIHSPDDPIALDTSTWEYHSF